ncbi:glycosyltransferase family 2 protein [Maribacter sp. X9]|uniref:glycosyltransferase family 2 protein n=1 Tax=Maribacter sp. X9 TaxID=3402159 RepID=UPI003AF39099
MSNPLISILIPYKNVEDYFEQCLTSICNQAYENWEVLAVNDHSEDASFEIAKRFTRFDNRIKLLSNTESGIISALRLAYAQSKGALITRMDADDHMSVDRLSTMANSLSKEGKGSIAIGQVHYFAENGVNDGYRKYEIWLNNLTVNGTNYKEIYKECVIPSPCWMVHRSDLDNCGAFESNRYPEDYDLAFRFYEQGLTCIPCNRILHYWRDYQTRTSRTSEHYAQNYFLDIKLHYFLKLEHCPSKTLVIWGAGKKGKEIAKTLLDLKIPFKWICDNPKKIGKDIYGIRLAHYTELEKMVSTRSIITVANENEQLFIKAYFKKLGQTLATDYYFFC